MLTNEQLQLLKEYAAVLRAQNDIMQEEFEKEKEQEAASNE